MYFQCYTRLWSLQRTLKRSLVIMIGLKRFIRIIKVVRFRWKLRYDGTKPCTRVYLQNAFDHAVFGFQGDFETFLFARRFSFVVWSPHVIAGEHFRYRVCCDYYYLFIYFFYFFKFAIKSNEVKFDFATADLIPRTDIFVVYSIVSRLFVFNRFKPREKRAVEFIETVDRTLYKSEQLRA